MKPRIQQHPHQEIKSGEPPYASRVQKNFSANEPMSEGRVNVSASERKSRYAGNGMNRKSEKKRKDLLSIFKNKKNI